ncbi:MAG: hypothetical protein ACXAD7_14275 [Candidatus Kariarchaeaceae archaeon]
MNWILLLVNILIFVIIYYLFRPLLKKVLGTARTTWREREYLTAQANKNNVIIFVIPFWVILGFIFTWVMVAAIVRLIFFS